MSDTAPLLAHTVRAIRYRLNKCFADAPPEFESVNAGHSTRTTLEILAHTNDVLEFAWCTVEGRPRPKRGPNAAAPEWVAERERSRTILDGLESSLEKRPLAPDTECRLLQGPLADALTHVGQIALYRRLADAPVPPEKFFDADI